MLIKLQKTRFSSEYFIIENARHVTYRETPLKFFSESELVGGMADFLNGADGLLYPLRNSCWYQMEEDGSGHEGFALEFQSGYAINEISFVTDKSERETIRFDGEAFICSDEGKTVHRIRAGGCPSVFRPIILTSHEDAGHLAPQAA